MICLEKKDNAIRKYNDTFEAINKNAEYKRIFRSQLAPFLKAAQLPSGMRSWIEPAFENEISARTKTSTRRPWVILRPDQNGDANNSRRTLSFQTNRTLLLGSNRTNPRRISFPISLAMENVMVPKSSLPYHVRQDLADLGKYLAWIISSRSNFNKSVTENVMGYAILDQLEASTNQLGW